MIRISVIGRLGQDATVNNVNEKTVINFSMAYSEKFKNQQGQDVDRTTWVSCAYWTDKTNVANYLKKGTLIYMEGKPEDDHLRHPRHFRSGVSRHAGGRAHRGSGAHGGQYRNRTAASAHARHEDQQGVRRLHPPHLQTSGNGMNDG